VSFGQSLVAKRGRSTLRPHNREFFEQVGFEKGDAIGEAEAGGIALRNCQRGGRNI